MIQAIVKQIGPQAITDEAILILFDETATDALKQYSIIQEVAGSTAFDLQEKDTISFDDQEYTITHVGSMANHNLTDISHVTLIFAKPPEVDGIANGIYLTPEKLPVISEGTVIKYY